MRSARQYVKSTLLLSVFALAGQAAWADDKPADVEPGDLWQAWPYNFQFGNHIDTHIQLELKANNGVPKKLKGALYVIFTGDIDAASGLPIARHPRGGGGTHDEACGSSDITCLVGWEIKGKPGAAKFLYHAGVNDMDHPVWMVNRAEEESAPAVGMVIPQPGYYSHFHWLSRGSTDPRADDVPEFCDKMSAGMLETAAPSAVNGICEGWFLQLRATRDFAFKHGGETILIRKGEDLRSHLNIVTNYRADTIVPITETRKHPGGSH